MDSGADEEWPFRPLVVGLNGLSEGSVNLDETLMQWRECDAPHETCGQG
jgi:hypothetical protein